MKKIKSLDELIIKFKVADKAVYAELKKAIARGTAKVHATAIAKFGHYQPPIGPFPAWKLLSIRTVTEKQNRGMDDPSPLIGAYGAHRYQPANRTTKRNGYPTHLRNSILMKVTGLTGIVGTNNPLAPHHEFGAPRKHIPPRPFLRPALFQEEDFIRKEIKNAIAKAMKGM